jgi:hypothetical protein
MIKTALALLLAATLGGCAVGVGADGPYVTVAAPEVYVAPLFDPVIIGPVWRPRPLFRPPLHRGR